MTREEAIKELKILKEDYWNDDGYGHETKQYDDTMLALDMAVNFLEKEPFMNKACVSSEVCEHDKVKILDKIRAEIEQNAYPIVYGVNNHEKGMTLYGILQIIDKYKTESEG